MIASGSLDFTPGQKSSPVNRSSVFGYTLSFMRGHTLEWGSSQGILMFLPRLVLIFCLAVAISGCINTNSLAEYRNLLSSSKVYYVSTLGSDQWSGMLPEPNPAGTDGPFRTLERARDFVRLLRRQGDRAQFKILVRGGVYLLEQTFTLGPEDSGTDNNPLIIEAYAGEKPILTGLRPITAFLPFGDNIFVANLDTAAAESSDLRQVFVNGKRCTLARYPNLRQEGPPSAEFLYVDGIVERGSKRKFKLKEGVVKQWANPQDGEIFVYPGLNYWNNIIPIAEIDYSSRVVTLSRDAYSDLRPGNRFFFQNLLEELDSPGEWYFDRRERKVYLWPPSGSSPKGVSIPVLQSIITVQVDSKGAAPSCIKIQGFTISGCEGTAVVLRGATNTLIARNTVFNAGKHGVDIQGGRLNSAIGNDIFEVGASGIVISGGDRRSLTSALNLADNNYVHHTGVYSKYQSGIECTGVGNTISHNLVHSTPRMGIFFDGNDHIIEYNHIHRTNREVQDSGIIYAYAADWTKRGNIIRFNYVHDSGGYGRISDTEAWKAPFFTYGIYLDDWTSGTTVYGNIIANAVNGGILIHGGKDNVVENNVIIEGGSAQVVFSQIPANTQGLADMFQKVSELGPLGYYLKYPALSKIGDDSRMSGNIFAHNIICYRDPRSVLYDTYHEYDPRRTVSDFNIIHSSGSSPVLIPSMKSPRDAQWSTWQSRGFDVHSVLGDPLLLNVTQNDYRLAPDSPALDLGFAPLPLDKIGLYQDALRASWPIVSRDRQRSLEAVFERSN